MKPARGAPIHPSLINNDTCFFLLQFIAKETVLNKKTKTLKLYNTITIMQYILFFKYMLLKPNYGHQL